MIERLTGSSAESARRVARETGISQETLSRWLRQARNLPDMATKRPASKSWSVEEKVRVLSEASKLSGSQLTAMLQREGLLLAELEQWRLAGRQSVCGDDETHPQAGEGARSEGKGTRRGSCTSRPQKKSGPPLGGRGRRYGRREREMILTLVSEAQTAGARLESASRLIGLSARTIERWREHPHAEDRRQGPQRRPGNALSPSEQARIVAVVTSQKYCRLPPKQLVPRLADEGIYLASESTMYRLQRRFALRSQTRTTTRSHVTRATAVHRATAPNQVWSWDITYLPTPVRGRFLRLYLVLDVWSRRIVGWKVHERESEELAAEMIRPICDDADIDPNGLVLHSDNGKPMRGSTMLATLQWLGIVLPSAVRTSRTTIPIRKPSSEP